MAKTTLTGPLGTLSIEREVIPVHYMSDIDAGWRFTDAAGHEHACAYDEPDHYPTLAASGEGPYWCGDCEDTHEDTHLECRQCHEVIRPGMTGPGVKYLQGPAYCTLNGHEITAEHAAEVAAQWRYGGG